MCAVEWLALEVPVEVLLARYVLGYRVDRDGCRWMTVASILEEMPEWNGQRVRNVLGRWKVMMMGVGYEVGTERWFLNTMDFADSLLFILTKMSTSENTPESRFVCGCASPDEAYFYPDRADDMAETLVCERCHVKVHENSAAVPLSVFDTPLYRAALAYSHPSHADRPAGAPPVRVHTGRGRVSEVAAEEWEVEVAASVDDGEEEYGDGEEEDREEFVFVQGVKVLLSDVTPEDQEAMTSEEFAHLRSLCFSDFSGGDE
jgi:hypothetical protein